MADYYYLISSLPKLGLGEKHDKLDVDAVFQNIVENLSPSDEKTFRYLIYPNDNRNLIATIAEKYKKPSVFPYFLKPSIVPNDIMNDFLHNTDQLPTYMQKFIEEHGESFATESIFKLEKNLLTGFYREVFETHDDFLVKYYTFQLNLKNIVVALNSRLYNLNVHDEIVGEQPINNQLIKSTASDLNLGIEFPFVESLTEVFNSKDVNQLEIKLDSILWNYIDNLVSFSFFNSHKLFGYTLQLLIIKRWMMLNKEEGKKRLDELTDKMMKNFKLPQLHK